MSRAPGDLGALENPSERKSYDSVSLQKPGGMELNELISMWKDYCNGDVLHDESDFLGLLSPKWTDHELAEIFRLVPLKDAVIDNLKRIYQSAEDAPRIYLRPKQENAATRDELKSIIVRFIESQRRCLLKHDIDEETRGWLERSDISVLAVDFDQLSNLVDPNDDLRPFILQEEAELRRYRPELELNLSNADSTADRVMLGIEEALYGLACDYYLTWFVLSPLVDTEIDYGLYFDFWSRGGVYALTDSQILVASPWN